MSLVIGFTMFCFGLSGIFITSGYMENDRRYTYAPPLTSHEEFVYAILIICCVIAVVGLVMTIFEIIKKRNHDSLQKLTDSASGGKPKNVCLNCGLNMAEGTTLCPKCGNKMINQNRREHHAQNND